MLTVREWMVNHVKRQIFVAAYELNFDLLKELVEDLKFLEKVTLDFYEDMLVGELK